MTGKNKLSPLLLILLVLTHAAHARLAPAATAQEATGQEKTFLWQVRSAGATVYLLGSVHFASPELYPLDPKIENAFTEADTLVLEISPASMSSPQIQQKVIEKGMYPPGGSIRDDLDDATYELLNNYLAANNMPPAVFHKMKPGLLALNLTTMKIMQLGYSPQWGIDRYFYQKAQNNKAVMELETVDEQLGIILDIADNNTYVQYTLESLEKTQSTLNEIMNSWRHGDAQRLNDIILKPYNEKPELQPLFNRIFHDRNLKMAAKIKEMLKTGQTFFVIVGAGHLVGDKGIVAVLRRDGHEVRQP